jgi:hypothetical protein
MTRSRIALATLLLIAIGAAWIALREKRVEPAVAATQCSSRTSDDSVAPVVSTSVASAGDSQSAVLDSEHESASHETVRFEPPKTAPTATLVYGYLRPAEGHTLVDAAVVLIDRFGERQIVHCGADGAYSISGVSPGRYWLSSGSVRNGDAHLELALDGSTEEKRVDLQLVLPPQLVVRAIDRDGKPWSSGIAGFRLGLKFVATEEPPGPWLEDLTSSAYDPYGVGKFYPNQEMQAEGTGDAQGILVLDREPPLYVSAVSYQRVVATKRIEPGQSEVQFVLDRDAPELRPGSLRMRFVDAETHAEVEANTLMLEGRGMMALKKQGNDYHAASLAPGWYRVRVAARGYEALGRRVRIDPGAETDLGDVALEHEQWISGTVLDPGGNPTTMELWWRAYDREKGPAPMMGHIVSVTSSTDGTFRIPGLSRGLYVVNTSSRESTPYAEWSKVVDTSSGPVENLRVELKRGVPLVLRSSDQESARPWRYKVTDSVGNTIKSGRLWSFGPLKDLLAPGICSLDVRPDERSEPKRIPLTIASDPIEIAIP